MPDTRFTGVLPPVVTPLTAEREFDEGSFVNVLDHLLDNGVHGVFVLGSTGEGAFADEGMRRQVISTAVRHVAGRVPVLAGVIDTQTDRVLRQVEVAADLGVDAVVATAPFYAITGVTEVRRHFEVIGTRSPVPVFAYDIPVCVHTKLGRETLIDLGREGLVAGVKDSSLDDVNLRWLIDENVAAGEPLTILTGHEVAVDAAYLAGAHGCVPGLANVDPRGYVALHNAAVAGDWETARTAQDSLARLMRIALAPRSAQGWGAGVGSFKTALTRMGIISTAQVPEPFRALSQEDGDAIAAILQRHDWPGGDGLNTRR